MRSRSFQNGAGHKAAFSIRPAIRADFSEIIEVDKSASLLFGPTGLLSEEALADHVPAQALQDALNQDWLLVAEMPDKAVVGFVMATVRDGGLYVDQLSVSPDYGRQGIGTALMRNLEGKAHNRDILELTLSTFRDLPWNAPFYATLGFRHIKRSHLRPFMLEIETAQAEFMDVSKRTFMRKRLRKTLFRSKKAQ
ncbi:GNAT family N-acetyltransferase [Henriciella mobilis]|uniref:GNAT family N-acetyltransferase n=1 Tax=Henriciella mobilis TaxID=2305467 RepID=A0A399RA07_9PROT|nr:GNAT family N-acetyltransferase [Henriciella mobilis]RIJ28238.1 GNAT family N-acetyltransferase [Henriciella mobilis]